ncbi:MAG: copper resistance protein NlpE [Thiohalospira sp.]
MKINSGYKVLVVCLFLVFLVRCNSSKKESASTVSPPDMHTSEISLDWQGTYKGVLPCADCPGIETEITLYKDKRFAKKTKYQGAANRQVFEESGTFVWDSTGSFILLNSIKNATTKYKVGENYLQQLDLKGNVINGELKEHYILEKMLE